MTSTRDRALRKRIRDEHLRQAGAITSRDVVLESFVASTSTTVVDFAAHVTSPTLLLGAEREPLSPPSAYNVEATGIRSGTFHVFPERGHLLPHEQTQELSQLVTEWDRRVVDRELAARMSPHATVDHTKPGHRPRFELLRATTKTVHRPIDPVAYDCLTLIVVRDGSAILFSEFGERPINVGDVVLPAANVLCGSEPERHITVSTIYVDSDYVLDQLFWQHVDVNARCDDANRRLCNQAFFNAIYIDEDNDVQVGYATPFDARTGWELQTNVLAWAEDARTRTRCEPRLVQQSKVHTSHIWGG